VHNGNGHGHGNGKRWLLIGLLILGGFWLVNDSYGDGYRDALVQTGQGENVRFYRGGPDFPWGLLILGGLGYIAWRKGAFDRFGGPGGPFGPGAGERGMQRYGGGASPVYSGSGQGFGPMFRGPRAIFEEWHHESHAAQRAQYAAPAAPQAPAPPAPADVTGNGAAQGGYVPTPPPPPPAPEYWASMARAAEAAGNASAPAAPTATTTSPETRPHEQADGQQGAAGPALERW
jgi:hypothetical protein